MIIKNTTNQESVYQLFLVCKYLCFFIYCVSFFRNIFFPENKYFCSCCIVYGDT